MLKKLKCLFQKTGGCIRILKYFIDLKYYTVMSQFNGFFDPLNALTYVTSYYGRQCQYLLPQMTLISSYLT